MKNFFHGTRADLKPGVLIEPDGVATGFVFLTSNIDEAIWEAELAAGEGPGRVYVVEPIGEVGGASELAGRKSPGYPSMSSCSRDPLRVTGEVTEWPLYHGTRADLRPGDLIKPGHTSNFGTRRKRSKP